VRADLEEEGHEFSTTTDSELIARILAYAPGHTWKERFAHLARKLQGAYSIAVLTPDTLLAMRDPLGVRPLCLGRIDSGWAVASESAPSIVGATFLRDEPGEIVGSTPALAPTTHWSSRLRLCIFSTSVPRPDSTLLGKLLYPVRMTMGATLARCPVDADVY
jgi:amidophosphoribosyltransferase